MPRATSPLERRKKLIEDFNRQRIRKSTIIDNGFEPIKRFTDERAVKQFDKWYSSTMGGTNIEK